MEFLTEAEHVLSSIPRADDAHYLSAVNSAKARFQAGTREKVFEFLEKWEEDHCARNTTQPICILEGEAGTGKSTIASEFSKRLQKRGRLGATFFFTRGVQDLNSPKKFFSTIASQLARSQPALRDHVIDAARQHLTVATLQQLEREAEDLILKPLNALPPTHSPIFVIVDALDECEDEGKLVLTLLRLLFSASIRPGSPLRIFLTSRPEPHYIHAAFTTTDTSPHVSVVSIQDYRDSVDHDIERLIGDMFSQNETSKKWAEDHPSIIPPLVTKSDGLFIYARTAVDFILGDIDDDILSIQERYNLLTIQGTAQGLDSLDALYRTVLGSVSSRRGTGPHPQMQERLKRVLQYLVTLQDPDGISPETLEKLTNMRTEESVPILNRLRSVVFFERSNVASRFRIVHATFREFLVDPSHAGEGFCIQPELVLQTHRRLTDDCFRAMQSFVMQQWHGSVGPKLLLLLLTRNLPKVSDLAHLRYAHTYLDNHHTYATPEGDKNQPVVAWEDDIVPPITSIITYLYSHDSFRMWAFICLVIGHLRDSLSPQDGIEGVLVALTTVALSWQSVSRLSYIGSPQLT